MAMNFLKPNMLPKVSCRYPSIHHFEPSNLISSDYGPKMRGFIASKSVLSPIDVEFEFVCAINVEYIVITTTNRAQKCSAIEISMRSPMSRYGVVGRTELSGDGVVFCNSSLYSTENPPRVIEGHHITHFNEKKKDLFRNANGLKVRIFTMKSIPSLKDVEVWGQVAKSCSPATKQTVSKLYKGGNIPNKFRDALTQELMYIPIKLPCGKTIDHDTFEAHMKKDVDSGNPPTDPITHLPYTETSVPVLDTDLRIAINMYMVKTMDKPGKFDLTRLLNRWWKHEDDTSKILDDGIKLDEAIQNSGIYVDKQYTNASETQKEKEKETKDSSEIYRKSPMI